MRIWILAAIGWTLLILVLCWTPRSIVAIAGGEHSYRIPHADKIAHAGMFAGFAFLWLGASRGRSRTTLVVLAGLALAVITELGQTSSFVNRDAGWDDGLFDMIGVALGGTFYYWAVARRRLGGSRLAQAEGA